MYDKQIITEQVFLYYKAELLENQHIFNLL